MDAVKYGIAPGGIAELREAGIEIRDRDTGERLPEVVEPEGAVLVGMRTADPGREVPGTAHGFTCSRCSEGVRLAPSGQGLAAKGVAVVCLQCFAAAGGR